MERKAVSPLLGGILLVVFTLGISVVVMNWLTPMANKNIEMADYMDATREYCGTLGAEIVSVAITFPNKTTISVQNTGENPINVTDVVIYNKNYESCRMQFDKSLIDVGDFLGAKNNSCTIFNECDDFLLVEVINVCHDVRIRFKDDLKNSTNGCSNF